MMMVMMKGKSFFGKFGDGSKPSGSRVLELILRTAIIVVTTAVGAIWLSWTGPVYVLRVCASGDRHPKLVSVVEQQNAQESRNP